MEVEEPWQALACCMEIARAVRAPDPAAYISHFPVHQDGSCNGLQHYAALGRDSIGAASVNLLPSDVPQDVYSGVAAQVEVFRRQDAKRGVRVAQVLEGFISRKVVKQTVMTVVYGVTRYGGRLQIERRLRELSDFPQEFVWEASHYLVRQVFNSLQEMFSGTRAIQHWLTESARLIAHSGSAVEWVTPLGIPIIQPYHRDSKVMISGGIQSLTFSHSGDTSQRPNTLKQKNGFPPNFIHSLDSSHMMLTALHCYRWAPRLQLASWAGRAQTVSIGDPCAHPLLGVGDTAGTHRVGKAGGEAGSDSVRGPGPRPTGGEDPSHTGCWTRCPEKDYT
uniref:DNA-directed RNA polymerase, mitochondrial-like n=1 Tax=Panthera onca TaxID=9690 RepID=UPI002953A8B9|nr:DNA-directed RNA polymerase, mitochondrial-like [Panthera onca]